MEHSVTLDKSKCKGCTTCIRRCPTEAIRVRNGKATIISERCIDCGECIRVCPHYAKQAVCDSLDRLGEFKYNVALPAPSLYGQFHNLDDVNIILKGLLDIGFDAVYEVARAAEMISDLGRSELRGCPTKPVISSACPACVRLICQRFPKLIPNISPLLPPVELAAMRAREEAAEKTGLSSDRIGVFFITPCPAKMTAAHHPIGIPARVMDGAISMRDIYKRLLPVMKKEPEPPQLSTSGLMGIGWSACGGEGAALLGVNHISVDGIDNVISILEEIENGSCREFEFVELAACTQGCLGGCLTVENPFAAKNRVKALMKYLPVSSNRYEEPEGGEAVIRRLELAHRPVWQLDGDMDEAMRKHMRIEQLRVSLPGLDCASCGAPSCASLAEDIVLGFAREEDCIFYMREKMDSEEYLPRPFRKTQE